MCGNQLHASERCLAVCMVVCLSLIEVKYMFNKVTEPLMGNSFVCALFAVLKFLYGYDQMGCHCSDSS